MLAFSGLRESLGNAGNRGIANTEDAGEHVLAQVELDVRRWKIRGFEVDAADGVLACWRLGADGRRGVKQSGDECHRADDSRVEDASIEKWLVLSHVFFSYMLVSAGHDDRRGSVRYSRVREGYWKDVEHFRGMMRWSNTSHSAVADAGELRCSLAFFVPTWLMLVVLDAWSWAASRATSLAFSGLPAMLFFSSGSFSSSYSS